LWPRFQFFLRQIFRLASLQIAFGFSERAGVLWDFGGGWAFVGFVTCLVHSLRSVLKFCHSKERRRVVLKEGGGKIFL
jgi:hypothetical protein